MTIVEELIAFGTKLCGQAVSGETIAEVLADMTAKYTAPEAAALSVQSESAPVAKTSAKKS